MIDKEWIGGARPAGAALKTQVMTDRAIRQGIELAFHAPAAEGSRR
jgi:hypothetical protein